MHPAEDLWSEQTPPAGYPPGVIGVPEPIPGTAFFPGGFGLWHAAVGEPLPPFPVGGVMVLGHDFHSEAGYRESLAHKREPATQPTWRNLVTLLAEAGIDLGTCFFTNAYVGLRAGAGATGPFPGATDATFVAHCRGFLLRQLTAQRPSLVLTLGVHAPHVLAPLSPQLAPWAERRGLKHLDAAGPVQTGVNFPGVPGLVTVAVALTHPSLRPACVRHRRYGGARGAAAELLMLRHGLAAAALGPGR